MLPEMACWCWWYWRGGGYWGWGSSLSDDPVGDTSGEIKEVKMPLHLWAAD